jgi:hypothetical protein
VKRLVLLLGAVACASPAVPVTPVVVAQGSTADSMATQLPIGQGRLNQDVLTLRVGTGSLDIRFVPLEESVMRLLSVDGYRALTAMINDQREMLDTLALRRGVREPGLALVTFYGLAPNTRFDPQLLTVSLRNQLYRPVAILPLSPSFSNQQLDVRGQATAIFVFERPLPVLEPFTVSYLTSTTSEWERKLPRLNAERARILGRSRVAADSGSGTP